MIDKINRKENFQFSIFNFHSILKFIISNLKFPIFTILFFLLIYTRFVNIGWGLPYPMHPDERNMSVALQQLRCDEFSIFTLRFGGQFSNCFNPNFFAYGQFPLYLGYLLIIFYKLLVGTFGTPISFIEATLSLRVISAMASIINVFILFQIIDYIISNLKSQKSNPHLKSQNLTIFLILIFVPCSIQFAHFGTTESLLMLFYSLIVYYSLLLINSKITGRKFMILGSLSIGLAIATKISSLIFIIIPLVSIMSKVKSEKLKAQVKIKKFLFFGLSFVLCTLIFALVFSPHNLINRTSFITSIRYESMIGTGKILVFYTRQFISTLPILFQMTKIFPYSVGWPVFILAVLGFFGLDWKDKNINLLRLAFLVYFIPNAFLFTKWIRFMAPILPLMLIFSILFLSKLCIWFYNKSRINSKFKIQNSKFQFKNQKFSTFNFLPVVLTFAFLILILLTIIPGIAYLSVYQNQDVRFKASEWVYKNIPSNSVILSETANVIDLPLPVKSPKVYKVANFDFYELDNNSESQKELKQYIKEANYIIVPSRRIFMNHPKEKYPLVNDYYEKLFSGKLGFKKVIEFNSYPRINFQFSIFNFQFDFPDEKAEETWTVFDHPVIRIYKKTILTN